MPERYAKLNDPENLKHVVLDFIYSGELEVCITEYDVYGDLKKYKDGLLRALQAAKQVYEMLYTEKKKEVIDRVRILNRNILPYSINSFDRKSAVYFAENYNREEEFTKLLKKDELFRLGLIYKYAILGDKLKLLQQIQEYREIMEKKKDFRDFEGYVLLLKLLADENKNPEAHKEALEFSKINFKKNSRANSSKIFGTPPDSYYDQFAIAILNLLKDRGIEVDVSGYEKLPKELIRGFD